MGRSIAVKLSRAAEIAVKKGHPWVFENSIEKGKEEEHPSGSLVVIFGRKTNKPFAFGLWDRDEIIRIKIIYLGEKLSLNAVFWQEKFQKALAKRTQLRQQVTGFRAIHGENDGFPGLVLDVYEKTGVLKIYSQIWQAYLPLLVDLFQKALSLERLVFRLSRKLSSVASAFPYHENEILGAPLIEECVYFEEYGVAFYAYPVAGHKTGFFLDQRPNRWWVQKIAAGKTVLDVFSYVGGFGIHALKGGAKHLISVDISQQAMNIAAENLKLNHLSAKRWTPQVVDAFQYLKQLTQQGQTFDLVIIDPPALAKQQSEVAAALKQYERLARWGAQLTAPQGYLVLGSCSSRVSMDAFKTIHAKVLDKRPKEYWQIIKEMEHDVDHPIGFEEGAYLKTVIYQKI